MHQHLVCPNPGDEVDEVRGLFPFIIPVTIFHKRLEQEMKENLIETTGNVYVGHI